MRERKKNLIPAIETSPTYGSPLSPFLLPLSVQRIGTTLIFTQDITPRSRIDHKPRFVRVLPLPENCFYATLQRVWDNSFGPEAQDDLVMWWPCDPTNPPHPSDN